MTTIKTTNSDNVTNEVTLTNDVASAMVTGMQLSKHAWYEVKSQGNQFGYLHIFRNNYTDELVEVHMRLQD